MSADRPPSGLTPGGSCRQYTTRAQVFAGAPPVTPLPPTRIDARCMEGQRHVGCNCEAPPTQPADYAILRNRARSLAMLGLQLERFNTDPAFRDAVRIVLAVTHVYD